MNGLVGRKSEDPALPRGNRKFLTDSRTMKKDNSLFRLGLKWFQASEVLFSSTIRTSVMPRLPTRKTAATQGAKKKLTTAPDVK